MSETANYHSDYSRWQAAGNRIERNASQGIAYGTPVSNNKERIANQAANRGDQDKVKQPHSCNKHWAAGKPTTSCHPTEPHSQGKSRQSNQHSTSERKQHVNSPRYFFSQHLDLSMFSVHWNVCLIVRIGPVW